MDDLAIHAEGISKTFQIPIEKRNTFKEHFWSLFTPVRHQHFDALKNISFEVHQGDCVGVIGLNGSGKSTLLKILAGIYTPNSGSYTIHGRVVPFLELGVGFNPELSARENIFLNGVMLGMTRDQLEKKFDEIVDFAEIRQFLDMPLKNYSSGMQVRLAFAIAIQAPGDIYLLDEVMAVGDSKFQKKCKDVFRELKKQRKTILFVSHDLMSIQEYCEKTILLEKGQVAAYDSTKTIIYKYFTSLSDASEKGKDAQKKNQVATSSVFVAGNKLIDIKDVTVTSQGNSIDIHFSCINNTNISDAFLGIAIYPEDFSTYLYALEKTIYHLDKPIRVSINCDSLPKGKFFISIGLTDKKDQWTDPYVLHEKMYSFNISHKTLDLPTTLINE
jgi:ABC-2 type transport system ATP-binding protein